MQDLVRLDFLLNCALKLMILLDFEEEIDNLLNKLIDLSLQIGLKLLHAMRFADY